MIIIRTRAYNVMYLKLFWVWKCDGFVVVSGKRYIHEVERRADDFNVQKAETSLLIIEANNDRRRSVGESSTSAKGENSEVFMHITSRVSIKW